MKNKKKIQDKLTSIKSKVSIPLPDDKKILAEEIPFGEGQRTSVAIRSPKPDDMNLATAVIQGSDDNDRTAVNEGITLERLPSAEASRTGATDTASNEAVEESTQRDGHTLRQQDERVSYGDVYQVEENQSPKLESIESILKQTEGLRKAQLQIDDLNKEIEGLRRENDALLSSADTFQRLSDDRHEELEKIKAEMLGLRKHFEEEIAIRTQSLIGKDKLINELKQVNSDLKAKVESNFKQIRKRERDLEYRLELAKVEKEALLKAKDKSILELNHANEKSAQDVEIYKAKAKEHYDNLRKQQQTVRSAVRALRIALAGLEGDFGVDLEVLKKAE
ncbi:MAG: hypothetical protein K2Q26_11600 [Bdellovibrionales bacterium]|nr:hypothetical protein [Bdellovibrionales bacterium]